MRTTLALSIVTLFSSIAFCEETKNGEVTIYYPGTEQPIVTENYVEGVRHGKAIWWYRLGKKEIEVNYVNGQLDGEAIEWNHFGEVVHQEYYLNGEIQGDPEIQLSAVSQRY